MIYHVFNPEKFIAVVGECINFPIEMYVFVLVLHICVSEDHKECRIFPLNKGSVLQAETIRKQREVKL